VPDPRAYGAATERALYSLARGRCYFPECPELVIKLVEGEPATNVHIAHIRGANRHSARYDEAMTDEERAHFNNLMLMCAPHHRLIDTIKPEDYSVDLLASWKHEREKDSPGLDEGALNALTDADLERLLETVMSSARPERDTKLVVEGGMVVGHGRDMLSGSLEHLQSIIAKNDFLRGEAARFIVLTIRNVGTMRSSVESISIYMRYVQESGDEVETALVGNNQAPEHNPILPKALDVGDATQWFTPVEVFTWAWILDHEGQRFIDFRFKVTLGSGEELYSDPAPSALAQPWI
jgi:hypothetical protein